MNHPTTHEGGCACGAWRFSVTGDPVRVGICHCMTCRRIHGSAFGVYGIFRPGDIRFSGQTQTWQSSEEGRRHFCPVCGSIAYMQYGNADEIDLPLGAFDEPGIFTPTYELWCSRREPWLHSDGRKEYAEDRP